SPAPPGRTGPLEMSTSWPKARRTRLPLGSRAAPARRSRDRPPKRRRSSPRRLPQPHQRPLGPHRPPCSPWPAPPPRTSTPPALHRTPSEWHLRHYSAIGKKSMSCCSVPCRQWHRGAAAPSLLGQFLEPLHEVGGRLRGDRRRIDAPQFFDQGIG